MARFCTGQRMAGSCAGGSPPDGVTESILPAAAGTPIRATADRVDAMGIGILRRLSLTGGAGAEIGTPQSPACCSAHTGDLTYVRYALQPVEVAGSGDGTFDSA